MALKRLLQISIVLSCMISNNLSAQTDCSCCTPSYNQFDFWIGEWDVFDSLGNIVGKNKIEKIENGCILNEHWVGAKGSTGSSYNYFDKSDSTWNQLWIDNAGNNLKLKGRLISQDVMQLESMLQEGKQGKYRNRIRWINNKDQSVTQIWEVLNERGKAVRLIFKGIYKPKK